MTDEEKFNESDSETEIDYSIYEKRREANVRKIVLLERLFAIVKQRLHQQRIQQLEARQVELLNQTANDYINKKAVLLEEHRAKSEYNTAFRTLQMESLRRKMVGKLETSQKNLIHNKKMAFERIETDLEKRIAFLESERKRCTSIVDSFALEDECVVNKKRNQEEVEMLDRLERELGMPLVVYMIPSEERLCDIEFADRALRGISL